MFKCGPDYLDTMHHTQAAQRSSINLDTCMASPQHIQDLYHRHINQSWLRDEGRLFELLYFLLCKKIKSECRQPDPAFKKAGEAPKIKKAQKQQDFWA